MAQGRGTSAMITLMLLFCMLMLHSKMAHANTYKVGDTGGWSLDAFYWPKGKSFRAGDILVFQYNSALHNVVVVDEAGYNACSTPKGGNVYHSGNDQIQLVKGMNYFICNFPGHCEGGMKIAVNAA
ncbi:basic blue protein-like [Gastrolobium bilobum]|uniref:basic blue protein-like n=1 Tax=Gastrolobium bilobum TaxID=150636 RepID=UPI002AB1B745|nr:basic blue protein-like [Gastrolobium bilobum]